jgi:GT2 family glycosyltransferase
VQDRTQITLSIATVCFHTPVEELLACLDSLITAVAALQQTMPLATTSLFIIDNGATVDNATGAEKGGQAENREDRGNRKNGEHRADGESGAVRATHKLSTTLFDSLAQQLAELRIKLELIQGHGNVGYGKANNLVISDLGSDFHLIINPDTKLQPDCLVQGVKYLMENPDVNLASPAAVDASGNKQFLCKRYPAAFTLLARGFFPDGMKKFFTPRLAKYEMQDLVEDLPTSGVPIASGCFMLCSSDALKTVAGFNEDYFLYFEDFDLSLRLNKIGLLAYVPAMKIEHRGGHAAKKGLSHIRLFMRSALRFYNTHGWRLFSQ